MGLLLHDGIKHGIPKDQYVRFDHPILVSNCSLEHKAELLMIFTDGDLYNNYKEKPKWCKHAMFVICDCPGCPEPSWGKALYIDASDVK